MVKEQCCDLVVRLAMKKALSLFHGRLSLSVTSPTKPNIVKATSWQSDTLIESITFKLHNRLERMTPEINSSYPESRTGRQLLPALSMWEEHRGWTVNPDLDSEKGSTTRGADPSCKCYTQVIHTLVVGYLVMEIMALNVAGRTTYVTIRCNQ